MQCHLENTAIWESDELRNDTENDNPAKPHAWGYCNGRCKEEVIHK